ncbi:MAG TPA: alcohol dehydrogenase catalytic domain-containing protein [Ktedonobacteraceae bacterium]|nr:alcohol dehydrogenase catalytic domain-containing protein [Ktedonobacteraceae bacterium]
MLRKDAHPSMMRSAMLHAPRSVSIEQVPVPSCKDDEVLVEVEVVGLCGSDVHIYTGERSLTDPMILGHEIAGRLVALGSQVPPDRVGQRVVVEPNIACGQCIYCRRGLGRICPSKQIVGQTRWGGLAEYVAVPEQFAWPIPDNIPFNDAVLIEPTAVAVHALNHASLDANATIAIIGCGSIGLLLMSVALARGHRVVVLETNASRRQAALNAGAIDALTTQESYELQTLLLQYEVTALFECVGVPQTAQLCLDAAPHGSRLVLIGLATENIALNPLQFVRRELDLRGAIIYDHPADFITTIALVASGKLPSTLKTSQLYPLESTPALLQSMSSGTLDAKPLISPRQL